MLLDLTRPIVTDDDPGMKPPLLVLAFAIVLTIVAMCRVSLPMVLSACGAVGLGCGGC